MFTSGKENKNFLLSASLRKFTFHSFYNFYWAVSIRQAPWEESGQLGKLPVGSAENKRLKTGTKRDREWWGGVNVCVQRVWAGTASLKRWGLSSERRQHQDRVMKRPGGRTFHTDLWLAPPLEMERDSHRPERPMWLELGKEGKEVADEINPSRTSQTRTATCATWRCLYFIWETIRDKWGGQKCKQEDWRFST